MFLIVVLFMFVKLPNALFAQEAVANQREVEEFFSGLFFSEFGYTLIGVKPISSSEVYGEYFQDINETCFNELKKAFVRSPNFVLKVFVDGPFHCVELINKRALRKVVRNNPIVLSFIKKEFQSEEAFFSKIESANQDIHRILKCDPEIIGYLLGYSKTNIEYYIRRIELGTYLQKYPLVRYHPLPGGRYSNCPFVFLNRRLYYKHLKPSGGFKSLEDEWRWIKEVAWDIEEESKPIAPYFVSLPVYVCRHGGDSELARERYKTASHKIAELFCGRKPSEVIAQEAVKK